MSRLACFSSSRSCRTESSCSSCLSRADSRSIVPCRKHTLRIALSTLAAFKAGHLIVNSPPCRQSLRGKERWPSPVASIGLSPVRRPAAARRRTASGRHHPSSCFIPVDGLSFCAVRAMCDTLGRWGAGRKSGCPACSVFRIASIGPCACHTPSLPRFSGRTGMPKCMFPLPGVWRWPYETGSNRSQDPF